MGAVSWTSHLLCLEYLHTGHVTSPVHHVLTVQVVQGHNDLGCKKHRSGVVESVDGAEVSEELSSRHVLQQHVEEPVVMMCPVSAGRFNRSKST